MNDFIIRSPQLGQFNQSEFNSLKKVGYMMVPVKAPQKQIQPSNIEFNCPDVIFEHPEISSDVIEPTQNVTMADRQNQALRNTLIGGTIGAGAMALGTYLTRPAKPKNIWAYSLPPVTSEVTQRVSSTLISGLMIMSALGAASMLNKESSDRLKARLDFIRGKNSSDDK